MSEENLPAVIDEVAGAGALVTYDSNDIESVSKNGDWLPRIQAMCSTSTLVQEAKMPVGVIGLIESKDKFKDIGKEINILVISVRPKAAMDLNGDNPMSFFDVKSAGFQKAVALSEQPNSGACYGPEFLVWFPTENTMATMHFGSATGRREAPSLLAMMKKGESVGADGKKRAVFGACKCTVRSELIVGKKNKWHALKVYPCSAPMATSPDKELLEKELKKFNNPQAAAAEPAAAAPTSDRER